MKVTKEEIQFIDNYLIKNKVKFWDVRKSLTANMSGLLASSFLCFQGLILQFYKDEFTVDDITNYTYIICVYISVYPFVRASLNLYTKTLNSVIKRYNLLIL